MRPASLAIPLFALLALACTDETQPSPPCDERCEDNIALRALREITKLAYNLTLQANPAGEQDESTSCPIGGSVRVFGTATSEPVHGATEVALTYEFSDCVHLELDEEPEESYLIGLSGTLTQNGIIAVQPTATTALILESSAMTLGGTVYDPPREYFEDRCEVAIGQDGNHVSGKLCGRSVGVDLGGRF
jgi:hypothetical protein